MVMNKVRFYFAALSLLAVALGGCADARPKPAAPLAGLFAATWQSLLERVEPNGFTRTSLTTYYNKPDKGLSVPVMYTRDSSVEAMALTKAENGAGPGSLAAIDARRILTYIFASS